MKINIKNKAVRTYFIATTAISLISWEFFFKYGAYGEIHFNYVFSVWIISVAISLAYMLLPQQLHPFSRVWLIPLALPSISLLFSIISAFFPSFHWIDNTIGLVSVVISLPYMLYLFLMIHQEDTMKLPKKFIHYLLIVFLIISFIGYINGKYNYFFMSCRDFVIAGDEAPGNCWDNTK